MESYLSVAVIDRHDATVLTLSGELDMASSPKLEQALERIQPHKRSQVVLDLGRVEFVDVAGLRVLLGAEQRARKLGIRLILVNVGSNIRRLLALSGATELLAATRPQ